MPVILALMFHRPWLLSRAMTAKKPLPLALPEREKSGRTGGKRKHNSNVETARPATLMAATGHAAFHDLATNAFEPRIIKWSDLGTTTDA